MDYLRVVGQITQMSGVFFFIKTFDGKISMKKTRINSLSPSDLDFKLPFKLYYTFSATFLRPHIFINQSWHKCQKKKKKYSLLGSFPFLSSPSPLHESRQGWIYLNNKLFFIMAPWWCFLINHSSSMYIIRNVSWNKY